MGLGALVLAALATLWAPSVSADRPSARAVWATELPAIDGRLDDPAWARAPVAAGFQERKPRLRAVPPVQTRFQVVLGPDAMYVAVDCKDGQPDGIKGLTRTRDAFAIFDDDAISLKLDVARDGRTTLGFALNPSGARMDYRGINEEEFRVEFDAVWTAAARRYDGGWAAEFRLPWLALGIDPSKPPAAIGFDVSRDHPRRNATYDWSLIAPPYMPIAASQYGVLTGLDVLRERTATSARVDTWTLVPHISGGFSRDADGATEGTFNTGADLSARLGAGWQGRLTVNTDFAQVDIDDQVVNLDRFGLFLPEKRDFYLTDLEVFSFGLAQEAQLLHTRRIGLVAGREISTLAGLKIVGRPTEALRVGLLQVTTRAQDDEPWSSHLAARGLLELGGGSNVGTMVTHRQSLETPGDRNTVIGVDGRWRGAEVPFLLQAFALMSLTGADARSPAAGTGGGTTLDPDEPAPGVSVMLIGRGELIRPVLSYSWYSEGLRTDMGYFYRVDVHNASGSLSVEPRIGRAGLEKLLFVAWGGLVADGDASSLLDWYVNAASKLQWDSGFWITLTGGYNTTTVDSAFTVGESTEIAAGEYGGPLLFLKAGTPSVWRVSAEARLMWQTFFDGELLTARASLVARPTALIRLEAGGQYTVAGFEDSSRDFDSALVNGRLSLGITTDLGLSLNAGWNHLADQVQLQSRLRFTYLPGSDLFVVYQVDLDAGDAQAQFQSLIVKAAVRW